MLPSRRALLLAAGGLAASAAAGRSAGATTAAEALLSEPFFGTHQAGIVTPPQKHTYFGAFDLTAGKRAEVRDLVRAWTDAAARMSLGETAQPIGAGGAAAAADSGEALGVSAARLTITFGFGVGLFVRHGEDRYGLAASRPAALVELPRFNGDQLAETRTGGDLSVQASADDPQVAFHAVRQLARLADGAAQLRWAQAGFLADARPGETPRNLMGFKDGTQRPQALDALVWVGDEGPAFMRGGSYAVVRRIRIALEHWDRTPVDFQEQVVGRRKYSGAPLGAAREHDPIDLAALDRDGNPLIAEDAHVRLTTAASNGGAEILRRGYSYNDGADFIAERWPPWRQGIEYDAGLLFICYQRDPRAGFIPIMNASKLDALNQFTTHVGSGLFACPAGVERGGFIGQALFDAM
jgi:deferrochelatase/peroxidase EfeB